MIRVLQVVTYMGRGGLETMLMNYYRHMDRDKVQFDFLVHRDFEADYDQEILSMGGKIYHVSRLVPWSRGYREGLKRFFKEHPEYKIVHVHQDCLSSVALECAKECGVPVRIAHSHSSNQDKNIKYLIKRHYMKQIPQFATDCFACVKDAGDWMFEGQSYQILHNAIDASVYAYSSEKAITIREELNVGRNLVMGHVGRFNAQKNHANCNNKLSIQLVRSLLIEEDPAQSRREPQASDETGPERGVKRQISGPFLPRRLHPEYGTPESFAEDHWPTVPRPGLYLHRSCRLSFPLAGIGGSGRCGSQWYLFHRKYTDA